MTKTQLTFLSILCCITFIFNPLIAITVLMAYFFLKRISPPAKFPVYLIIFSISCIALDFSSSSDKSLYFLLSAAFWNNWYFYQSELFNSNAFISISGAVHTTYILLAYFSNSYYDNLFKTGLIGIIGVFGIVDSGYIILGFPKVIKHLLNGVSQRTNSIQGAFVRHCEQADVVAEPPQSQDIFDEYNTNIGITLGTDMTTNIPIVILDKELNQHCLVIGTTGSGKTTTLLNIAESCCQRGLPLVYIDGKGSISLINTLSKMCTRYGRKLKVFSLEDDNATITELAYYNPFSCGNFTGWKNKIITLALDAENKGQEHYSLQEQNYISLVCEILYKSKVYVDLEAIIAYLKVPEELQKLANRISHKLALRFVQVDNATKKSSDIVKILEIFYYSNYGKLFSTSKQSSEQVINLKEDVEDGNIIVFLLNAASYKRDTNMLGRLIINDINSVWAEFGSQGKRVKGYCIFDEFAAYASPNMASVLAMQRDNGLHAVIGTQSINAISVESMTIKRVAVELIANCNTFIMHKLNDNKDIEILASTIGTQKDLNLSYSFKSDRDEYNLQVRSDEKYIIPLQQVRELKAGQAFICRTVMGLRPRKVKIHRSAYI